jgi:DNA-binding transcriptional ArsR family regulator
VQVQQSGDISAGMAFRDKKNWPTSAVEKELDSNVIYSLPLVMTYQVQQPESPGNPSVLAVLADPTRQSLLQLLRRKPLPVGELARHVLVSRPAVSQHLKILRDAHLVREQREGTRHYFSLDPGGFAALRQYVDSLWHDSLNAFAAHVATQKKISAKPRTHRRKGE